MQKRIKVWLELSCVYLAIAVTLIILFLSLVKTNNFPASNITHGDKLGHLIAYSVLSFFWTTTQFVKRLKVKMLYVLLAVISYGVVIEIMQAQLTSYRSGDFYDIMANSIGVLIGYIFFKIVADLYLEV